jgi:hypothetical protein
VRPQKTENTSELESSSSLPPINNRMTEVIRRIEEMYEAGVDYGYDREDSFIDDSDILVCSFSSLMTITFSVFVLTGFLRLFVCLFVCLFKGSFEELLTI